MINLGNLSAVKLGDKDVIASGSLVVPPGEGAEFTIADLSVAVVFETVADRTHAIDGQVLSEKRLRIVLKNFASALGTTTVQPLGIGNLSGRPLFASFAVHAIGSGSDDPVRVLYYTFLLGALPLSTPTAEPQS